MTSSNNIGILYTNGDNSGLTHVFFAEILDSFKKSVEKSGYDVAFFNSDNTRLERPSYLNQANIRNFAGVLIACVNSKDQEIQELVESGIAVVAIDDDIPGAISIKSDNLQGIKELTNYIIEMGHRRIGYIMGDDNTVSNIRLQGFLETCREHGINVLPEYIRPGRFRDLDKAAYQTEHLLRLPDPPTCIMYSDDFASIGGRNIIYARGLSIPVDVSIAGYDGTKVIANYEPRITTVVQDTSQIGKKAAEKLINRIKNGEMPLSQSVTVKPRLEKGRTVGKIFSY